MKRKLQNITSKAYSVAAIVVLLFVWQILSSAGIVPSFLLPSPLEVVQAFVKDFPLLMEHAKVTLTEGFLGLTLGCLLYTSLSFRECVKSAKDYAWGGAKYNTGNGIILIGVADLINSMEAIRDLVYDRKLVSMEDMVKTLDADFEMCIRDRDDAD